MNPLAIDGIWLLITGLIGCGWINTHRAWVKGLCGDIREAYDVTGPWGPFLLCMGLFGAGMLISHLLELMQ